MSDFLSGPIRIPPVKPDTVVTATIPPGTPSDADLWEQYHRAGVPDSLATTLVKTRPSAADVWEHLTAVGVSPDVAKQLAPLGTTDTSVSLRNIGRSAAQGATLGWSDELNGLVRGDQAEAIQRQRQAAFHAAHPVVDIASKVVGGLAAPLAIAGAAALAPEEGAAAGVGGGALALRGALAGGAIAGTTAAGENDGTYGQRLKAGLIGALPGALLGAAAPFVGSLVGNGLRRLGALGPRPLTAAEQAVGQAIARTGGASDAAALNPVLAGDARATLADMSDPLRLLAARNAAQSPDAESALRSVIATRANPNARIAAAAPETGTVAARAAALATSRRAFAGPAYDALNAAPIDAATFTSRLGKLLAQPKISAAWAAARQNGLIGTLPDEAAVAMKNAGGASGMTQGELLSALTNMTGSEDAARSVMARLPATPTPAPSVSMVHDLKSSLADAASAAEARGQTNLMTRLSSASHAVNDFLSDQVPGYAEVNAEYMRRLGLESALKAGAKAAKSGTASSIREELAAMAPDAQEQYRHAMAAGLIDRINAGGPALAQKLATASPTLQARIEAAFGTQNAFDQFMQAARREAELAKLAPPTAPASTGGSIVNGIDAQRVAAGVATHSHYGPTMAALHIASQMLRRSAPKPAAVSDLLMTKGDAISQLLDRLNTAPSAIRPQDVGAAGAGVLAGQAPGLFGGTN